MAKITEYASATPTEDFIILGVDTADTSMAPTGTTVKIPYFNIKGTEGGHTLTVAPTGYTGKADYYCDGTADDVQIQLAINTVNTMGGGTVKLLAGTFTLASTVDLLNNVTLSGVGQNATTIHAGGNYQALQVLGVTGEANYKHDIVVKDLKITCSNNVSNTANYTVLVKWAYRVHFENVLFYQGYYNTFIIDSFYIQAENCIYEDSVSHAIRVSCQNGDATTETSRDITFNKCMIDGTQANASQGLYVFRGSDLGGGTYSVPARVNWINGVIKDTNEHGVRNEGREVLVAESFIENAGRSGLRSSGDGKAGEGAKFINNTIRDCTHNGVFLDDGNDTVNGCFVSGNRIYQNAEHGVTLVGTTDTIVSNNTIFDNAFGASAFDGVCLNAANNDVVRPVIVNNTIFDSRSSGKTQDKGVEVLRNAGVTDVSDAIIMGNNIHGNANAGYNTILPSLSKIFIQDDLVKESGLHLYKSARVIAVANDETLDTSNTIVYYDPGGASRTGVILTNGTSDGQIFTVINTADAAETITFAATATSRVSDGAFTVINRHVGARFVWNTGDNLWYRTV